MLSQTLFCDFCNVEINPRMVDYARLTTGLGRNLSTSSHTYDLCLSCLTRVLGLRDMLFNKER